MFGFLKDKLKNWIGKTTPKREEEIEIVETKKPEKKIKEKTKDKKIIKKIEKKEKKKEKQKIKLEEPVEEKEQEKEKTIEKQKEKSSGFWGKIKEVFTSEKEEERKTTEKIWGDIKEKQEEFAKEKEEAEKKGILSFFKSKFSQERFDELWPELELSLLQGNVALKVVDEIKKQLQEKLVEQKVSEKDVAGILKEIITNLLLEPPNLIEEIKEKLKDKKPIVIAFVGINGSGKTTSIAKFAHLLKKESLSVCIAAADTFRSAAIEQMQQHADKLQVHLIKKDYGAYPASVGFEAIAYAKKHALDVVLIDTAGRMNTKDSLMKEMEKIIRVCQPDFKIFVGESITGNDATEQAAAFNDSISLDGIILSKADVDEKGGTSLSVSFITKKPILYLGIGQTYDDLEIFSKEKIIKNLGL